MKKIFIVFMVILLLGLSVVPSFAYSEDYGAFVLDADTRENSVSFSSTVNGYYSRTLARYFLHSGSRYAIYCSASITGPGTPNLIFYGTGISSVYQVHQQSQPILISPSGSCYLMLVVYQPGDYSIDYYITVFEIESSDSTDGIRTLLSSYNVDPYNIPNGQSVYYKSVPDLSYISGLYSGLFHTWEGFFESETLFPFLRFFAFGFSLIFVVFIVVFLFKRLRG